MSLRRTTMRERNQLRLKGGRASRTCLPGDGPRAELETLNVEGDRGVVSCKGGSRSAR